MKLAVISMRPKIGDKKSNLQKMENYIKKTKADISKAKEFDYKPKYSLEQGLKETIEWFDKTTNDDKKTLHLPKTSYS